MENRTTRRDVLKGAAAAAGAYALASAGCSPAAEIHVGTPKPLTSFPRESSTLRGHQRLTPEALEAWRSLQYGMFIHYGGTTFAMSKLPSRPGPLGWYRPSKLDVGSWVSVARDAGMKYAILTAKHCSNFCLWPGKLNRNHVLNSPVPVDVMGQFVAACRRCGLMPGFYYSGESAEDFGDTPCTITDKAARYEAYMDYLCGQLTELMTWYGPIGEVWIDGPNNYTPAARRRVYNLAARLQPQAVVAMNADFQTDGMKTIVKPYTWPTDIVVMETALPPFWTLDRFMLGQDVTGEAGAAKEYFLPCEIATCMDDKPDLLWFGGPHAYVRDARELFAMRLLCHQRRANLVFNVPPTDEGIFRQDYIDALMKVQKMWERFNA
ncbi:MAG: alpha-L-fucosidase [Planctomycetaceae bacterium]|nr:alpha-L-fucosidase [Planctomycetaceae bacterium]